MLANATNTIAEGEVLQLMNCDNPDTTEADYMEVIYRKTAKLFEAGARIGAILAGSARRVEQALARYGRHLGQAFQLVDDALDYDATGRGARQEHRRRPRRGQADAAADLRDGARQRRRAAHDPRGDRDRRHAQPEIDPARDRDIGRAALHDRARAEEVDIAIAALAPLPASKYRDALVELAQFAVHRRY